ncbi:MAG: hypothetical protein ACRDD1_02500, partial [Planctomycetia bacterium]
MRNERQAAVRKQLEVLEDRTVPAPVASIVGLPAVGAQEPLLGETVTYSFNFTNTGTLPGFSPYFDLAVDTSGPDGGDGYGAPTVSGSGPYTLAGTIPVTGPTYNNPFSGETGVTVPAGFSTGDTIYVYRLPFGSMTSMQTTSVNVSLPMSNQADLNTPLPINIRPGFRDDEAADNGPALPGTPVASDATPRLYRMNKIYLGPEDETATGPNYIRRYRIEADIAPGQTVTNFVI